MFYWLVLNRNFWKIFCRKIFWIILKEKVKSVSVWISFVIVFWIFFCLLFLIVLVVMLDLFLSVLNSNIRILNFMLMCFFRELWWMFVRDNGCNFWMKYLFNYEKLFLFFYLINLVKFRFWSWLCVILIFCVRCYRLRI